jgi:hypothetical protein
MQGDGTHFGGLIDDLLKAPEGFLGPLIFAVGIR